MPKFPKSDGYKMKGFTYPGESPLKGADATLIQGARAMYTAGAARTGAFIKAALPGLMKGVEGALKGTVLAPEGVKEARKEKRGKMRELRKEKRRLKGQIKAGADIPVPTKKDLKQAKQKEKSKIKSTKRKAVAEAWKESKVQKRRSAAEIDKLYKEYKAMGYDHDEIKDLLKQK